MVKLADRMSMINPSATIFIANKATAMKAAGQDVISLALGEPDFDTPDNVKEAAIAAIRRGETKYTQVDGIPILKKAICDKFKRENNLEYSLNQISVGSGSKQVIWNALQTTLDLDDEVIIPAPYWVSYLDNITFCDGKPVIVNCSQNNGFKMRPEELEMAITNRTKWLILNSPCNPTGAVYSKKELEELAKVLLKYDHVNIMSDDIYEHILYSDEKFYTMAEIEPRLYSRILTINGVSKAYSMTGWRLGYGAGPVEIIKAMATLQSQSTVNPCSISQAAAVEALDGNQDFIKIRKEEFKKRRDLAVKILNECSGLYCLNPQGAFYIYVNCSGVIDKKTPEGKIIKTDNDFVEYLLDSKEIAVVPGDAFGLSPYFRISYAIATEKLEEACSRIKNACASLI